MINELFHKINRSLKSFHIKNGGRYGIYMDYKSDLKKSKKPNAQQSINSTGYDSPPIQEARQLNKQAGQYSNSNASGSSFSNLNNNSTSYDSPSVQEARQLNKQSNQDNYSDSATSSFGSDVNPLDEAKQLNKKSKKDTSK